MKTNPSRKKGAIELSVTTIIVIVIGVTLLSLGLMWVRGMFSSIRDLTTKSFEDAERILGGEEEFSGKISSADSITIKTGEKKVLVVRVRNIENQDASFLASVGPAEASGGGLKEGCIRTLIITSQKTIEANGIDKFEIGFDSSRSCNPGSEFYKIQITSNGRLYDEKAVSVRVE